MITKPKRRHELVLKVSADTFGDLIQSLEEIQHELREEGNDSVCGGSHSGFIIQHIVTPGQTHDGYHEQLQAYLAHQRAAKV